MSWLLTKLKNYGVAKAIDALDSLEKPLGDKIQNSIDEFRKLDGYGIAIMIVDEVQSLLRIYFGIKEKDAIQK